MAFGPRSDPDEDGNFDGIRWTTEVSVSEEPIAEKTAHMFGV